MICLMKKYFSRFLSAASLWLFAWRWILLVVGFMILPYGIVWLSAPPETEFLGGAINPDDLSVYLAAIRQGAAGEWLFEATFTPETITPKFTYPFYMLLGRLMTVLPLDSLWIFHVARMATGIFLMALAAYWLHFLNLGQVKQDAFFLIFLSGGWGWLTLAFGWILPDIHVAEWTPFLTLLYAPHFILGLTAELLIMTALIAAQRANGWNWPALTLATIGAAGLGLSYSFRMLPIFGVIVLYLLVEVGRDWRRRLPFLLTFLPALFILAVLSLYYALAAASDPLWQEAYVMQNQIPSPNLFEAFMGWGIVGLLFILGGAGAFRGWRRLPDAIRLCFIWFGVGVSCLYLPVPFQGRFALGVYVPLAVIAAWSLHNQLLPRLAHWQNSPTMLRLTPTPLATARRVILILAIPSIFVFMGMAARRAEFFPEQYFIPLAEARAAEWLADHSDQDDLILVGSRMGNYLPRHITGRVFVGQYYVTVDPDRKVALVAQFFAPETDDEWRLSFLDEWQISHIYYGYYEAQVGPPPNLPGWAQVYADGGVLVYKAGR
jgi:hypothetical protein